MSNRVKTGAIALTFVAAVAAVLVVRGGLSQAAASTCAVPSATYPTIQMAVDAPSTCTTIKVASGDFAAANVTRSVTIKGNRAGDAVKNRTFDASSESTVTGAAGVAAFTISAKNVTIDGFSITNPDQGTGVTVKTVGDNALIKNNIVDTVGGASYASNATGVYLELGPDSVRVNNNRINNIQSTPTAQGILIGDSTSTNPSLKTVVKGNVITNVKSATKGAYGVIANNGANVVSGTTGYTEVQVLNNTINALSGAWAHAIGLEGKTPNAEVTGNVVSGLTATTSNIIGVFFEDNPFYWTSDVNNNSFALGAANFGVAVAPALSAAYPSLNVDSTCNWWGAASGPGSVGTGSGSMVSAGVDFEPWLKNAKLDSNCGNGGHGDWNGNHHDSRDRNKWNDSDD